MTHPKNIKIISFAGLAGSGKTTATTYLTDKGYPKISFGNVIRVAMQKAHIDPTEENERSFIHELFQTNHEAFVAEQTIPQINALLAAGQHRIIADGSNTLNEYTALKQAYPGNFITVAIVAPKHLRHHRLAQRTIHPVAESEATKRDWTEIEFESKGGPIALADYYIINDRSIEQFHTAIDTLLTETGFSS
ncbi:hypothetical protein A2707_04765 [Candidatus Saccharibacteria bacterium RIFCSPHIGHO2_01_FULL_45_15]|nr:MAG: hypothetical protein A2707_04765 [Candidatus Saccharibacteria bacterium RIFCSPHIGHO2_01_FULL_45_15]OGL27721.1 MAG: hypothetical protein A3C39_03405 [Candidatus Saccharibacteria bacterium RIFCSPHIGHO2_02_FULL_46_12]OGL32717.1 MAG: hypothetical protein A3E76_05195 [Candidatus Saccharibacteria bacterium RIFCSPHIGHO2_12_FULL_44_22]